MNHLRRLNLRYRHDLASQHLLKRVIDSIEKVDIDEFNTYSSTLKDPEDIKICRKIISGKIKYYSTGEKLDMSKLFFLSHIPIGSIHINDFILDKLDFPYWTFYILPGCLYTLISLLKSWTYISKYRTEFVSGQSVKKLKMMKEKLKAKTV